MTKEYANVGEEIAALRARMNELQQKITQEEKQTVAERLENWQQSFLNLLGGTAFEVRIEHKVQIAYDDESYEYGEDGLEWFAYLRSVEFVPELYSHLRSRPDQHLYYSFHRDGVRILFMNPPLHHVQITQIEGGWPEIAAFALRHNLKLTHVLRIGRQMCETRQALDEIEVSLNLLEAKGLCDLSDPTE
jgi:hypothetical protein